MIYTVYIRLMPSQGHSSSLADVCTQHSLISTKHPKLIFRPQLNIPLARNILLHFISHIFQRRLVGALHSRLQVTCVGYCSKCQSKNVGKYFQHTGGIQIRSENLIVCALYFMGYYWVLNIYWRLLGPWLGINPIGHYVIIVQPPLMIWQFLADCKYPVMSYI